MNLAVWGLGHHAHKNLLPALAQSRAVRLAGVCSRDAAVVKKAAEGFHCTPFYSPAEMLGSKDIDVVYVATPTGLHAAHGREILGAGKHFWCDKPITCTEAEARELVVESRNRRVSIAEGFMYLYHPQWARIRELVQGGSLGRLQAIHCRFGIPPLERKSFRNDPALGGSAFLDVGSYPVSALASLILDDPVVEKAVILSGAGSAVDTSGHALLRYPGGLHAVLDWSTDTDYRNRIDLTGSEGSLSVEFVFSKAPDYVPTFRFIDRNDVERVETGGAANHFVAMFAAFRAMVDDVSLAEAERVAILRRAHLAQQIRSHSQHTG